MPRPTKDVVPDLRRLVSFKAIGDDSLLLTQDDLDSLIGGRGSAHLFLDHYDQKMMEDKLEQFGLLRELEQQDFHDVRVKIDTSDRDRQRLLLFDQELDDDHLLAELVMTSGSFAPTVAIPSPYLKDKVFRMLYIQWLCLQNPRSRFTPERPALPGQRFPGLGVGALVASLFERMGQRLHMDGIISVPEFMHNAILYARRFSFMNPVAEGALRALLRDLGHLPLAVISWAVECGSVIDQSDGTVLQVLHEDQVFPLDRDLRHYFRSRAYHEKVFETEARHHFILDEETYRLKDPILSDGSPREPVDPGSRASGR